jgi:hypothetical protein
MIKARMIRWEEYTCIAHMGGKRGADTALVGKLEVRGTIRNSQA